MAIVTRAATPDLQAGKYDGLVKNGNEARTIFKSASTAFFLLSLFLLFAAAQVKAQQYQQTNLVSDVPGLAPVTDPNLVNPWGLIASSTSPWWVSNNGTGTSTLYNGAGVRQTLVVTVAGAPGDPDHSSPTGIVFNGSTGFQLVPGVPTTAARFIFVTDDGTISGWNPSVNANHSILKVNNSASGAIYLGATIAQVGGVNFLYVANFSNASVDVFDTNYASVTLPAGAFTDPELPEGYAPFNVQEIGGNIYVAYALQNEDGDEEEAGRKFGYVDVFDVNGTLLQRVEHGPWMNAPWGLALAPATGFGKASGKLLVGMFGSGEIATFNATTGEFEGLLRGSRGRPIEIEGLWALRFGNGANAGPTTTLFFTAGIDDETHGLFGTITPIPKRNESNDDM
jgi:uncharacterized protein (TIGR03118 family)